MSTLTDNIASRPIAFVDPLPLLLPPTDLEERAARVFPHSPVLQREWIRAVQLVRSTRRGWVCDVRRPEAPL